LRIDSKYRAVFCSADAAGACFFWHKAEGAQIAKTMSRKKRRKDFIERETNMEGTIALQFEFRTALSACDGKDLRDPYLRDQR
jgi:hypothetical protein